MKAILCVLFLSAIAFVVAQAARIISIVRGSFAVLLFSVTVTVVMALVFRFFFGEMNCFMSIAYAMACFFIYNEGMAERGE